MRRLLLLVALLLAGHTAWSSLEACGDKFLMVGRGARFQRAYASVYPGKILIYARPSTDTKAAIRDPQFQKILRQAGHGVSVIEDWALFEHAVKSVPVDVILTDVGEADKVQALASASPSSPTALYVLFPSNVDKSKALQQQYMCKLKASDRAVRYLDEIESAMKARAAAKRQTKS